MSYERSLPLRPARAQGQQPEEPRGAAAALRWEVAPR